MKDGWDASKHEREQIRMLRKKGDKHVGWLAGYSYMFGILFCVFQSLFLRIL